MTEFKVLGTLEVSGPRGSWHPTAPKQRQILGLLLLCPNQVVNVDLLIAELWGDNPPKSAMTTMQTYIYQLRKIIDENALAEQGRELLLTKPPGYVLYADPAEIDAFVFRRLVTRGRTLLDDGEPARAGEVLRQALDLWQGPVLADVTPGCVLQAYLIALEEERLRTLELRIQADLRLGRHRELISELRFLVATHPLNEWFSCQLITTLGQAGRRNEALQAYQNLRTVLRRELGLEPSHELQRLQYDVLNGDSKPRVASQ